MHRRRKNSLILIFLGTFSALTLLLAARTAVGGEWQGRAAAVSRDVLADATAPRAAGADGAAEKVENGTADEEHLLLLRTGAINTSQRLSSAEPDSMEEGYGLRLIQFRGAIQDSWLAAVEATGSQLVHYVANNGYLVWADAPARVRLDELAAAGDVLQYSAPYSPALKSDKMLAAAPLGLGEPNEVEVTIQILRHDHNENSKQIVESLALQKKSGWEPVLAYENLQAVVSRSSVATIASLPDVVWIEPFDRPQLTDEKQGQILAGYLNEGKTAPAGPGYVAWLKAHGFSEDPQDYAIIDITDDGVGTGDAATAAGDETFRVEGKVGMPSRLAYLADCSAAGDAGGPDGHGHLNASIAGGYDARAGAPFRDELGYQFGLGINPFGRLASSRVFDGPYFDYSNCGGSYASLIRQSYQAGARIISNSWGNSDPKVFGIYTTSALAYDTAVRDADATAPGNQEVLILFSAGNSGTSGSADLGTIGSPANAKNVLTVGATENVRPTWTDGCNLGPSDADNLQEIATYSSRGPAPVGRAKPELVAPGTHITGTASTHAAYNGEYICDKYMPGNQTIFGASSGTSHSAPAVAGAASLASYWLTKEHGLANPSPALLKAFLVATSSYLTGQGAGGDLPSDTQGFGMPNLRHAFGATKRVIVEQADPPQFSATGQSWSKELQSADPSMPTRVVLAYTDAPGFANASDPRVNNLDLKVTIDGEEFLGNHMTGQWSQAGGEADDANNIEAVYFQPGLAATFEINVAASNLNGDGVPGNGDITDQDFALVCDNCISDSDVTPVFSYFLPFASSQATPPGS